MNRLRRSQTWYRELKARRLAKYGLDFDSLFAGNPRLIYVSITASGQNGPRASHPGYDLLIQG